VGSAARTGTGGWASLHVAGAGCVASAAWRRSWTVDGRRSWTVDGRIGIGVATRPLVVAVSAALTVSMFWTCATVVVVVLCYVTLCYPCATLVLRDFV